MKKNVELAGKSNIRKDLVFKHQKNAQELKIQLSLYCNQNESLNLLEISLNLKNIYLNNSIFPFNCRIPFLLSFSKEKEQIRTNYKYFLISQKEEQNFALPLIKQISNISIIYLPFSPLNVEKSVEFDNNPLFLPFLFSLYDITPIPSLHYFDERRILLSMKMRFNTVSEITKEMISELHYAVFPSHEYDESQLQNLSFIEMKTLAISVSSRFFAELGLSFKILQEIPSAVRESRDITKISDDNIKNMDIEILLVVPPSDCSILPQLIYGNQQFELVTALKIENNQLVSIYYLNEEDGFYEIRKNGIVHCFGLPSPTDKIIAIAYRCVNISNSCLFNLNSFIDRYDKVDVYSVVYKDDQGHDFKAFAPGFNAPYYSQKAMDCDELRCMTNDYFFYEFDPQNNTFPLSPLPSICGKSILMLPKTEKPHLLWCNMIYAVDENEHEVYLNNELYQQKQNPKLLLSDLFLPLPFQRPLYSVKELVERLHIQNFFPRPFILASVFNNTIIRIYKPDEQIHFDYPIIVIALEKQNDRYVIPFLASRCFQNHDFENQSITIDKLEDSFIPYLKNHDQYIFNDTKIVNSFSHIPLSFSILSKPSKPFYLFKYYLSYCSDQSLEYRTAIVMDKLISTFKISSNYSSFENFSFLANYFSYQLPEVDKQITIELLNGPIYLIDFDGEKLDQCFDLDISSNGIKFYNIRVKHDIPKYSKCPVKFIRFLIKTDFSGFPDFLVKY